MLRPSIRCSRRLLIREKTCLRVHFRKVLTELAARDVAHLPAEQRAMRARLLVELERYARAGRFPRNGDFPGRRVPCFVDAYGTHCAVAHLIETTGDAALSALPSWLQQAGLTVSEAARIQPSYGFQLARR